MPVLGKLTTVGGREVFEYELTHFNENRAYCRSCYGIFVRIFVLPMSKGGFKCLRCAEKEDLVTYENGEPKIFLEAKDADA